MFMPKVVMTAEYAWAGGKEFGVHIGWRKYLYECTPFGYVNLWNYQLVSAGQLMNYIVDGFHKRLCTAPARSAICHDQFIDNKCKLDFFVHGLDMHLIFVTYYAFS